MSTATATTTGATNLDEQRAAMKEMDRDALTSLGSANPALWPTILEVIETRSKSNGSGSNGDSVSTIKNGRIRVRAGAQIDVTLAQAAVVLANATELAKRVCAVKLDKLSSETKEGRNDEPYTVYLFGGQQVGTNDKHKDVVRNFQSKFAAAKWPVAK